MTEHTPAPGPVPPTDARATRAGAVAGAAAVCTALGASELMAAFGGSGASLVTGVGNRFVDLFAAPLKSLAVALFGTHDKQALLIGTVLVAIALGCAVGVLAVRRRAAGVLGFAAFGVVGTVAAATSPLTSRALAVTAGVVGTAIGLATLLLLLRLAPRSSSHDTPAGPAATPGGEVARRRFLAGVGGAGVAAAGATVASRSLRAATAPPPAVALPAAATPVVLPEQPFGVAGLSPYVVPAGDFYRIDTALLTPRVDAATWQLRVTGLVERPLTLSYADLLGMGLVERAVTLSCVSNEVGGDLVGNAVWLGVPLAEVLRRAGVAAGATQVVARSVDGFTTGFPTATALDGRTALIAVGMNGAPLPADHGFPARVVIAGLYGYVSATKWLAELELTTWQEFDAYWITRGWAKEAPVKTQARIDVPRQGIDLAAGPVTVAGVAWAPGRGVERVEVSVDGGPWQPAELGRVASADTWVQWRFAWTATGGDHRLRVRATDGTGAVQDATVRPPEPDGATGYHERAVRVR